MCLEYFELESSHFAMAVSITNKLYKGSAHGSTIFCLDEDIFQKSVIIFSLLFVVAAAELAAT